MVNLGCFCLLVGTCDGFICVFWEAGSIAAMVKLHLSTSGTIALINNTIYFLPSKKTFEGLEK